MLGLIFEFRLPSRRTIAAESRGAPGTPVSKPLITMVSDSVVIFVLAEVYVVRAVVVVAEAAMITLVAAVVAVVMAIALVEIAVSHISVNFRRPCARNATSVTAGI